MAFRRKSIRGKYARRIKKYVSYKRKPARRKKRRQPSGLFGLGFFGL